MLCGLGGSEICDEHIEVYEIKNDKKYGLADLLKSTYNLFTEKDELLVKKRPYMDYDSDI